MHAGVSKVTGSRLPIDVQREMRLRAKGGHRFVGLRCAARQHRTRIDRVEAIEVLVGLPTCDVTSG